MTPLQQETLALQSRYDEEPSHSDQVTFLALRLYDELQAWHQLGQRARELLETGARLHDIGWSQSPDGAGHHKASARLILNHPWAELSGEEVAQVAQIARYHRKLIPRPEHAPFQALPKEHQKKVRILASLLRVADGLDRTHSNVIADITARVEEEAVIITVQPRRPWQAERSMAGQKSDLLELTAERSIRWQEETPKKQV